MLEKFVQKIKSDGNRYEVHLPWKECHPPLPDNRELCFKRLMGLLRRLRQDAQLLSEYDTVIRDQLDKGVVEFVTDSSVVDGDRIHYLPHHCVIRQDKDASKLRIVYDASARSTGPSLNDCLYTGPKFGQSIFDIILRFCIHKVALVGDIEKAFLMISVQESDRDSLRFLWISDTDVQLVTLRFTRVVFGVSASPFLLNATINHHMNTYRDLDPTFVDKFLSSIYVDDVVAGAGDVESTLEFYKKARHRLAAAGFRLRKFLTNSDEFSELIQQCEYQVEVKQPTESTVGDGGGRKAAQSSSPEDDQSYAKISLGVKTFEERGVHKVLGIQWNVIRDEFQFDMREVAAVMENSEPTKRNVVSAAAKYFDPLGVVSPVTISFKTIAQELCEARVDWDESLTGVLLTKWQNLLSMMRDVRSIVIPRCMCSLSFQSARLVGFCDASLKAYAAVVYVKFESEAGVKFVAAKTRVAPVGGMTIPRLELSSALLLSKLVDSIQTALKSELVLGNPVCFTDSMVSLYWIQGIDDSWKQFVESRVSTIRSLVDPVYWNHCPGRENPADIPSRGMSPLELTDNSLWLNGPDWLYSDSIPEESCPISSVPEGCRSEMKRQETTYSLVTGQDPAAPQLSKVIDIERYSSSYSLFRVTGWVFQFLHCLRGSAPKDSTLTLSTSKFEQGKLHWIKDCQSHLRTRGQSLCLMEASSGPLLG